MTQPTPAPASAPRKQQPVPFSLLPDRDADSISASTTPNAGDLAPAIDAADHLARVTTPGALVITPSGRVARVIGVVPSDSGRVRIEVEYLEVDPVALPPIMLRPYPGVDHE